MTPPYSVACSVTCSVACSLDRLVLDALELEELLEAVAAVFAPDARLLVAPERGDGIERSAIHLDLTGPQAAGHLVGVVGVGRPHTAGQPVDHPVGDRHGVVF